MTTAPDCPFGWPARFRLFDFPRARALVALAGAVAVGVLAGWPTVRDTDDMLDPVGLATPPARAPLDERWAGPHDPPMTGGSCRFSGHMVTDELLEGSET